ncbi:MAG: hypothetical protein LQ350_008629 [Teloschistes chrysophthalmus]|nr:MAG: hypothetical protein LQ350_008629 [Niorma chrysophthalma]
MATPPTAPTNEFDNVDDDDDRREEEAPPDGGYGWAYGIYLSHYLAEDIFPEASTWDYAFIGGFNFSIAMLIAPIVTVLTRRFGIHTTMIAGLVFQCGGFTAASFATRIWQLHLTQGVLIGCGIGFLYIPSLPVLSQWFVRRRSLANGISAAGSGVGGATFAWGTEAIIQHLDVGWALRITGIIAFIANSAAIMVIRDRNREVRPSQLGFDTKLLRRDDVMLLLAWIFISMLGYVTLLFSLSDFALSIGFSRAQATDVIGFLNVGTAVGRPLIGILSDRWSRIDTAGVLTLLCGLSCFAFWLPAISLGLTVFFAIICGAIVGVFWMMRKSRSKSKSDPIPLLDTPSTKSSNAAESVQAPTYGPVDDVPTSEVTDETLQERRNESVRTKKKGMEWISENNIQCNHDRPGWGDSTGLERPIG